MRKTEKHRLLKKKVLCKFPICWKKNCLYAHYQKEAEELNYKCTNEVEVAPKKKTCNDNDKLKDNMCYAEEIRIKQYERYCKEGTLIEKDKCLILDDTTNFIDGTVCDHPNSKLVNDTCIIYEIMNAERG